MTGIPVPPEVVIPMIFSQMEDEPRRNMAIGLISCEICSEIYQTDSEEEAAEMVDGVRRDVKSWLDTYIRLAKQI